MTIGFDFDKVFVNYPPLVPYKLVDLLYKGKVLRKGKKIEELSYRFPGQLEKKVRILSHLHYFRPPITSNIEGLKQISKMKGTKVYLISSRFDFLKKATDKILERYNIKSYFNGIYFNFKNKQPHLFKEELIKKLKIEKYIDDDLDLALYLSSKFPNLKVYWLTNSSKQSTLPKNVIPIKNVTEFINKHL